MPNTSRFRRAIDTYRDRAVESTHSLFAHAPNPLADTLTYKGDPGVFGPDSVTWPVIGDAAAILPKRLRRLIGVRRVPGAVTGGRVAMKILRWALGSSPSWHIALVRVGAPIPPGRFRQPLPTSAQPAPTPFGLSPPA